MEWSGRAPARFAAAFAASPLCVAVSCMVRPCVARELPLSLREELTVTCRGLRPGRARRCGAVSRTASTARRMAGDASSNLSADSHRPGT
jgi:hypothetical protein